jgi:hypothetical protein
MRNLETHVDREREYTISPDAALPSERLPQMFLRATLRDETTGAAPTLPIRASCPMPRTTARAMEGGLTGISGVPGVVFSQSDSAGRLTAPYTVGFRVEGERYLPFSSETLLAAGTPRPDSRTALIDLGTVDLHRAPVTLMGRTMRRNFAGVLSAVSGATVRVLIASAPVALPNLLSLHPGVSVAREASATVRAVTLTPLAGDGRRLLAACIAGSETLLVSDSNGLAVGTIIGLDASDPGRSEFVVVAGITASADPGAAATVQIKLPCRVAHRSASSATAMVASAPGPVNGLAAPLVATEVCLVASTLTGIAANTMVEIQGGGPAAPEYQQGRLLQTLSGPEGYFQLPPLSRASEIVLRADNGATTIDQPVVINYRQPLQTVNFIWT